jgi:Ca-activated chloride channel family protein
MRRTSTRALAGTGLALTILVAACGGGGAATPTPAVTPAPTAAPTAAETPGATVTATNPSTGEPSLSAPAEIGGGTEFEVSWTGPNALNDYVTIVQAGVTKWTNEDYFNTNGGTPQKLNAPTVPGDYELWYVSGADSKILFRLPIKILAFVGSLTAADAVEANREFDVAWTGPNGSGDYVTIVKLGATQWTNEDYFNTNGGTPQKLLAPVEPGAYEIWYVTGLDRKIQVRRPVTVTPTTATLDAPGTVSKGAQFQVSWTGPNGPGDYVTIVAAGSAPGAYLSYFNANGGTPGTLTAPDAAGNYEVWYVAGQRPTVLAKRPIQVK